MRILVVAMLTLGGFLAGPHALAAQTYPNGALLRPEGQVKVYFVQDGKMRWVVSPDVFNQNKLDWSAIEPINQTDFKNYAAGQDITGDISGGTTVMVDLAPAFSSDVPVGVDFGLLWNTWKTIQENYPNSGALDPQKLVEGAADGMIKAVGDPYTVLFAPTEAKKFTQDVEGKFYGIGAELGYQNGIVIVAPLHGLPAENAGIRAGDKIMAIDGTSTADMNLDEATSRIRGEQGTKVKLTIQRSGVNNPLEFIIQRDLVTITSVELSQKTNETYVIKINNFFGSVEEDFAQAVQTAQNGGMRRLILDLRNDPGGLLNASVDIASQFIPKGKLVVSADFGTGKTKEDIMSSGGGSLEKIPLVVVVNGGSASASEILAGALRDSRGTTLVGEKTFGKGSVQQVFQFAGGAEAKVTIAHWLTPSGQSIDKMGITPDVVVPLTDGDSSAGRDPQLDRAMQIVQGLPL